MPTTKTRPAPKPPPLMEIPLGKILEPELPAREVIDPAKLEDLAGSIKAVGVLQPILVEEANGSYRIHAGHRRFLASRLAGLLTIPAVVYPAGGVDAAAVTEHENVFREDLNPAEEALWMFRILEQIPDRDTDKLCARLKLKRAYVEERLILLNGDDEVFAALKRGEISFAVGRELNKYKDDVVRRMRLENSILGGATARLVREWRQQDETIAKFIGTPAPAASSGGGDGSAAVERDPLTCCVCQSGEDKHDLVLLYVHRGCQRMLERRPELIGGGRE